jgi:hypothetical protein
MLAKIIGNQPKEMKAGLHGLIQFANERVAAARKEFNDLVASGEITATNEQDSLVSHQVIINDHYVSRTDSGQQVLARYVNSKKKLQRLEKEEIRLNLVIRSNEEALHMQKAQISFQNLPIFEQDKLILLGENPGAVKGGEGTLRSVSNEAQIHNGNALNPKKSALRTMNIRLMRMLENKPQETITFAIANEIYIYSERSKKMYIPTSADQNKVSLTIRHLPNIEDQEGAMSYQDLIQNLSRKTTYFDYE